MTFNKKDIIKDQTTSITILKNEELSFKTTIEVIISKYIYEYISFNLNIDYNFFN